MKLLTTLTILLLSIQSYAGYQCQSQDGAAKIVVSKKLSRVGNTIVELVGTEKKLLIFGNSLFEKNRIIVTDTFRPENKLTLLFTNNSSNYFFCNRRVCNEDPIPLAQIKAELIFENETTYLNCYEFIQ
jgi:hypothetical protein